MKFEEIKILIIGKWVSHKYPDFIFEFLEDGTFTINNSDIKFPYSLIPHTTGLVQITAPYMEFYLAFVTEISQSNMTIIDVIGVKKEPLRLKVGDVDITNTHIAWNFQRI